MEIKLESDEDASIFQVVPCAGYHPTRHGDEDAKPDINQLNQAGLSHEMTSSVEDGSHHSSPDNSDGAPQEWPSESSDSSQCQEDMEVHDTQQKAKAGSSDAIGPYASRAGIYRKHFTKGGPDIPLQTTIKNGLVLELHKFLRSSMTLKDFACMLVKITGTVGGNPKCIVQYVCRLIAQRKKFIRRRGEKLIRGLADFLEQEFFLVRARKGGVPYTPRETRLSRDLAVAKANAKDTTRRLAESELSLSKLNDAFVRQRCVIEKLQQETAERRVAQENAERLVTSLYKILGVYNEVVDEMEELLEDNIHFSHPGKLGKYEQTVIWFKEAKKKGNKARRKMEKLKPQVNELAQKSKSQN